eukprot:tig00021464_g21754.t1
MSHELDEFRELLGAEMYVEMDRLRTAARHGIPKEVRGEVWKYLLDVSKADRSEEMSQRKRIKDDYKDFEKGNSEVLKQIKGEVKRYQSRSENSKRDELIDELFRDPNLQRRVENVLLAYTNHNSDTPYHHGMIYLMAPFVLSLSKEPEIFFCFQTLMTKLEELHGPGGINRAVANFMVLFRTVNSELYNHFEEEELEANEWALSWSKYLLGKELPMQCVLRLWDTYFSACEGLQLHVYACLAILEHCQEELLELDHAELIGFLQHLPVMDMDQIINKAYRIKDEVRNII